MKQILTSASYYNIDYHYQIIAHLSQMNYLYKDLAD